MPSSSSWLQNPPKTASHTPKAASPAQGTPARTGELLRQEMGRDTDTQGMLRDRQLVRLSWKQALLTKGSSACEEQQPRDDPHWGRDSHEGWG